ncbi:MAG: disulfide bond formation protein B [Amaricoccus sp.]
MIPLKRHAMGAAAGSAALLVGALAFQYLGGLAPCHLCLLQRWPHALAVLIGLLILVLPRRGLALVAGLALLVGAGIAAYHVGVEQHWWAGPTSCTAPKPGSQSAADLLKQIEATPVVACDQIAWSLAGISMAGWNLLASLALAVLWLRAYASSSASQ